MKQIPMTSIRQNWKTPRAFYQALDAEFNFEFDPCPPNPHFDGLACDWKSPAFVNPPFKDIARWVEKSFYFYQRGGVVVMLIPSRTDTRWWHNYVMKASEIRFIEGRLKYEGAKFNAPFPSCVVVFRATEAKR